LTVVLLTPSSLPTLSSILAAQLAQFRPLSLKTFFIV